MQKIDLTGLYITDDIVIDSHDSDDDFERYEYTENMDDFLRFVAEDGELRELKPDTEEGKATRAKAKELEERAERDGFGSIIEELRGLTRDDDAWSRVYDEWRDGIGYDEQYAVPMMTALRYFPDFVSFDEADRYKCSGSTCLLYDSQRDAWAVGMTGGGMDLAPHLLATFINLKHCIPEELAASIRRDYNAYVSKDTHERNCDILAAAWEDHAQRSHAYANRLRKSE